MGNIEVGMGVLGVPPDRCVNLASRAAKITRSGQP
jgi:hypothetical protein